MIKFNLTPEQQLHFEGANFIMSEYPRATGKSYLTACVILSQAVERLGEFIHIRDCGGSQRDQHLVRMVEHVISQSDTTGYTFLIRRHPFRIKAMMYCDKPEFNRYVRKSKNVFKEPR